jgi:hypothetical protein
MKQLNDFNIFLRGPEEIVTCPECGSRTDFTDLPDSAVVDAKGNSNEPQLHNCLNVAECGLTFISEIDLDDETLQGEDIG